MRRFLIATLLILCTAAVPATANAAKRPAVGIGDNHAHAFQNAHMRKLPGLKTARLVIPWDWYRSPYQTFVADSWINSVKQAKKRPLVTFNRNWGRKGRRQIPRMKAYVKGFKQFRKRFPHVREFSPWNEPNAVEQPFYRKPAKAARYFNALRRACRKCTIIAGDLKDGKTMGPYLRTYKSKVRGARIWALHNYKDATRKRPFTAEFLRAVRGQVWLTETGGLRNRGGLKGQAKAVSRVFRLAKSSRRIKRIYFYQWLYDRGSHWDSAFIARNGTRRPAYFALRKGLRKR
jgi:polysaccharide biosynthesis protein PslG